MDRHALLAMTERATNRYFSNDYAIRHRRYTDNFDGRIMSAFTNFNLSTFNSSTFQLSYKYTQYLNFTSCSSSDRIELVKTPPCASMIFCDQMFFLLQVMSSLSTPSAFRFSHASVSIFVHRPWRRRAGAIT
jgi:hypothetical protein